MKIRHTRTTALLFLLVMSTVAAADDRAKMENGSYPDRAATWSKFAILGVKLGSELEKVPGFTCGPPPGTDHFSTQNHSCVKFLDARCKGKPVYIKNIRGGADVPAGQSCFMEESSGNSYLDRKLMLPPLSAVRIVGTDSTAPLVFSIVYTFAADDLTAESNLGKALIAKYGLPTSEGAPRYMIWEAGEVRLAARCRETADALGEFCQLTLEDRKLDKTERELQEEANEARKKRNAPTAPKL